MLTFQVVILGVMSVLVHCQRGSFAGTRPIGFPEVVKPTTTADPLGNRFGEANATTERLPIEANGDRDLVDRISKWPVDKQPFWYLNWKALEAQRKNPQTYPQRPSSFAQQPNFNAANTGTLNSNTGTLNSNTGTLNPNAVTQNSNTGTLNSNAGTEISTTGTLNSNAGTQNSNTGSLSVATTGVQNPEVPSLGNRNGDIDASNTGNTKQVKHAFSSRFSHYPHNRYGT